MRRADRPIVPRGSKTRQVAVAATLLAVAALLGAACSTQTPATFGTQPVAGTFEEAAHVALGELSRLYGPDADPLPVDVSGTLAVHNGQEVWRLDGGYEVTVDDERRVDRWILYIDRSNEAALAVLTAEGPSPAPRP